MWEKPLRIWCRKYCEWGSSVSIKEKHRVLVFQTDGVKEPLHSSHIHNSPQTQSHYWIPQMALFQVTKSVAICYAVIAN